MRAVQDFNPGAGKWSERAVGGGAPDEFASERAGELVGAVGPVTIGPAPPWSLHAVTDAWAASNNIIIAAIGGTRENA